MTAQSKDIKEVSNSFEILLMIIIICNELNNIVPSFDSLNVFFILILIKQIAIHSPVCEINLIDIIQNSKYQFIKYQLACVLTP